MGGGCHIVSDGDEMMEEDGIEWSVDILKRKIEEMDGKFTDEDIQRIWNLRIRMELVLTEDFLGAFFERKNLSDEKLKDEIKDCSTGQCENCEHKELLELKDDLEKLGYEMDISEIQRIRNFKISNSVIVTTEFMEKYTQVIELDENDLKIQLDCENDENEIDIRIKRLKQICDDAKIEVTEGELLRLTKKFKADT
ncbi:hypothetical protein C1646_819314 [Rhizophagus diaphanus]|nr:hypothetical protein C1646_819314 [Rhizophagus diaphanus] [Rhizophagus sp. MUCL 43196]